MELFILLQESNYKIGVDSSYRARFFKSTGPVLQKRLLKDWEATFNAFPKELEVRESGEILSIEEYTLIRRDNCALRMGFTHIEYALGIELPDEIHENPVFNEMYLAALDMAWLLNVSNPTFSSQIK